MKTPEQLKAAIRNIAKDKSLRSQEVLLIDVVEAVGSIGKMLSEE